jgi:ATP-dependent DNA helicase UvrD/PcrA
MISLRQIINMTEGNTIMPNPVAPHCPKCNTIMVLREAKKTGKKFWGCPMFPKCNGTVWMGTYTKSEPIVKKELLNDVKGSAQQVKIWESVQNAAYHIIVDALAGSGKTFTITYALKYISSGNRVILCAFNTDIANELKSRVPDGMEASTMNSFAFTQVKNAMPVRFVKTKLYDILDKMIAQKEKNTQFLTQAVYQIVNLVKSNLLDINSDQVLDDLTVKHSIEMNDSRNEIYQIARNAFKETLKQKGIVDYMDQVYFVYAFNLPVAQYAVFIGDEIQDWNALQQYIMMRAIENGGRFIGVGDRNQAIYGFSGADTNSIDNLRAMLTKTKRPIESMPLTMTRRCPISHVRLAQQIVPELEAMPNAIEGIVESFNLDKAITQIKSGDMGICRRNAPLISIAYKLIREGKTVIVKGRNIGEGLISLINKLRPSDLSDLIDKAEAYRTKEADKLIAKGKKGENALESLNDKINTLMQFIDNNESVNDVRRAIETMFNDMNRENAIILSSVHRSKGLESDTVFIFEYDRIELKLSNEEFQLQERNLHYIALTRSKNALYLVASAKNMD